MNHNNETTPATAESRANRGILLHREVLWLTEITSAYAYPPAYTLGVSVKAYGSGRWLAALASVA